ncbi:hypothetical protein GEMRC1_002333 [Eukaryota sp. GEM-RC1]
MVGTYTSQEILVLSEMIRTIRVKTLALSMRRFSRSEAVQNIFQAIGTSNSITSLDLGKCIVPRQNLGPIFNCNCLKKVVLPPNACTSSSFDSLHHHPSLSGIVFTSCTSSSQKLAEVLKHNQVLRRLEIKLCGFDYDLFFNSISFNTTLRILIIGKSEKPLDDEESESFIEMLERNTALRILNLNGKLFTPSQFPKILETLERNSTLEEVLFPYLSFTCLIQFFESILTTNLRSLVNVYPHHVNGPRGFIYYDKRIYSYGLISLLNALQRSVPIQRVKFRDINSRDRGLAMVVTLVQIRLINRSVLKFDNFDHDVDVDKGLFSFSPDNPTKTSSDDVSSLQSFLECHSIKRLVLKQCWFSNHAINTLCDLIRASCSLTSVHFTSRHELNTLKLIDAVQANSFLQKVTFDSQSNQCFTCLLTILELVSRNKIVPNIEVFPHSIDFPSGIIRYEQYIEKADLTALSNMITSNVPIRRVYCRGLHKHDQVDDVVLQPRTNSVEGVDESYHCIDIENCLFTFSPLASNEVNPAVVEYVQVLIECIGIKELKLRDLRFTDDVLIALCDLIEVDVQLTSIDFSDCRLCDKNFQRILTALNVNSSIVELNFSHNCVSDLSVDSLSNLLKVKRTIKKINLSNNSFTIDGVVTLARALHENSFIIEMSVGNPTIDQEQRLDLSRISEGMFLFD